MAKAVTVHKPRTFAELLEIIENFQAKTSISWYRGCHDRKYELTPTLYRHPTISKFKEIADLEVKITTRFIQRSLPFLSRTLPDEWDKLFLMQHYGVPTRLLDWTENPFVALYFALTGRASSAKIDSAIWLCDPVSWNRAALKHLSFTGDILDQSSTFVRAYSPGAVATEVPTLPIMIYGAYNSPRIVAQRGGFALFGQGVEPMEKVVKQEAFPDGVLEKIEVSHELRPSMLNSLFRKGFTESVVFPDLDGLSRELRRTFGF